MKANNYTNLLDLQGEGDELLEWDEQIDPLSMPTDIPDMIKEVERLKKQGRDPISTEFKPLRQDEPASSDFAYHLEFYYKNPREFKCLLLLQLPLAHMRAGTYNVKTKIGLGFVTKSNRDGSLLRLQIVKKGGDVSYYNYNAKTKALKATI